jgi:hypothetical protein
VTQLKYPSPAEQTIKGKSIIQGLAPRKGKPIAISNPKISNIKAATTIPNMHNTLGMEVSSIGERQKRRLTVGVRVSGGREPTVAMRSMADGSAGGRNAG